MNSIEILHSEFDIETHKKHFVNYLEVIIDPHGKVHYAVPSHQEWLIEYGAKAWKLSRKEFESRCPKEYLFNYIEWLTGATGCLSVWNDCCIGSTNGMQRRTLRKLKEEGLYTGAVPEASKDRPGEIVYAEGSGTSDEQ